MSNLPDPLPVILCGQSTKIGKPVAEAMLPEIEGKYQPQLIQSQAQIAFKSIQLSSNSDPLYPNQ